MDEGRADGEMDGKIKDTQNSGGKKNPEHQHFLLEQNDCHPTDMMIGDKMATLTNTIILTQTPNTRLSVLRLSITSTGAWLAIYPTAGIMSSEYWPLAQCVHMHS